MAAYRNTHSRKGTSRKRESDMESLGVIILAAGLGKRMHSARAKVLHPLAGKPLLSRVIDAVRPLHPGRLVVVVGPQGDEVRRVCGGSGIEFAPQKEQRGTGDAVRAAQNRFNGFRGDILITCGDTPLLTTATLSRFVGQHRARGATLSVLTARLDDPAQYGRVIRADDGQVLRITEAKDASPEERAVQEINTGIYCARANFLFPAVERLRPANAQGEYYLTDIVAEVVGAGLPTYAVLTPDPHEVAGINSREELAALERIRRAQLRNHWMAAGVTLEDPETVYIDEDVTIGQDTVIGPNTHLKGKTSIGTDCRIDGSAYIENCTIGNGVHVEFSVVMHGGELGDKTAVGPFAHLRPGTVLAPRAEIGNFVEVKKSVIGEHTKAKHLAYIGDTEIGRDSNIGAGTITCNYDGFRKHRTKIGDRVQVGSDTTLVAPITIHDDVYIATATTVRHDVPAGALVFNPREEQTRDGWTAAKRAKEAAKKEVR
jgi:bifunctional UDP-N-acetylglucosamine pyrophosphorylase/glucosamine-1-phosphate N-acetyltransferase